MPGRRYGGGRGRRRGRRRAAEDEAEASPVENLQEGEDEDLADEPDELCDWELLVKNTFISVSWPSRSARWACSRRPSSVPADPWREAYDSGLVIAPLMFPRKPVSEKFEDRVRIAVEEQVALRMDNEMSTLTQRIAELEAENSLLRDKAEASRQLALKVVQKAHRCEVGAIGVCRAAETDEQRDNIPKDMPKVVPPACSPAANAHSREAGAVGDSNAAEAEEQRGTIPKEPPAVLLRAPLFAMSKRQCFSTALSLSGLGQRKEASPEIRPEAAAVGAPHLQSNIASVDLLAGVEEKDQPSTDSIEKHIPRTRPPVKFNEIPLSKVAIAAQATASGAPDSAASAAVAVEATCQATCDSSARAAALSDEAPRIFGTFTSAFLAPPMARSAPLRRHGV